MKNQRGFSVLPLLVVLLVVCAIGLGGYYVYTQNQDNQSSSNVQKAEEPSSESHDEEELTQSYQDPTGDFSFKYPSDWTLASKPAEYEFVPDTSFNDHVLTSPGGFEIKIKHNPGGRGGFCEPAPEDKPFQKDNSCTSEEFISVEKTGKTIPTTVSEITEDEDLKTINKEANIYLVRAKYAEPGKEPVYFSGLEDDTDYEIIENDPQMGALLDFSLITIRSGYVDIYVTSGDSEEHFETADAQMAESILKSFTFVNRD